MEISELMGLTTDELIEKMRVPEPEEDRKIAIKRVKDAVKGYFKDDPSLVISGNIFKLGEDFVQIATVVTSTGRVFIKLLGTEYSFSVHKSFLTDEQPEVLPFTIGQIVKLEDGDWTVTSVNPSSRHVRIEKVIAENDTFSGKTIQSINVDQLVFWQNKYSK